jgi:N-acetylmuramoyl-L-alanine amidase
VGRLPVPAGSGIPASPRRSLAIRRGFALVVLAAVLGMVALILDVTHLVDFGIVGSSAGSGGDPLDPSTFSPGACMAFAPTTGDRHRTVFLDAGHGGIDPGGVGTTHSGHTIDESSETLPVELDVMALLRARGFRVVVSRTQATTVLRLGPGDVANGVLTLRGAHDDVAARDVCANDAAANVLVGIYYDAGGSTANAGSLTTYDTARPFSSASLRLADLIQHATVTGMNAQGWGIPNDGVPPDTTLGSFVGNAGAGGIAGEAAAYHHLLLLGPAQSGFFTTPSLMPGAVTEPLYLTDPYEGSIADGTPGRQVISQGIASGIEQYFAGSSG